MLLLPAFPIATTQMKAPTPTEMPRIVRTLLTQLRLSAADASRNMFLKFIESRANDPARIHQTPFTLALRVQHPTNIPNRRLRLQSIADILRRPTGPPSIHDQTGSESSPPRFSPAHHWFRHRLRNFSGAQRHPAPGGSFCRRGIIGLDCWWFAVLARCADLWRARRDETRGRWLIRICPRLLRPAAGVSVRMVHVPGHRKWHGGVSGGRFQHLPERCSSAQSAVLQAGICGGDCDRHSGECLGHSEKLRPSELDDASEGPAASWSLRDSVVVGPRLFGNSRCNVDRRSESIPVLQVRAGDDRSALGLRGLAIRDLLSQRSPRTAKRFPAGTPV